jgi:nicotinamidase-related amidase
LRSTENTALILIDLQKAIDDPSWGVRNNPQAEANIARLLEAWRATKRPVIHIRHDSPEPHSTYRPGQIGHQFKDVALPHEGEPVIGKHKTNAFIGTELENRLRSAGHATLIIAGVITNNSVEATVRMAGDLGFETYLVADACFTFARKDWDGRLRSAEEVHAMSLANLSGEYCTVITTSEAMEAAGHG